MTSNEIRQQFLDFFASKEHTIVESSPVVPLDDPTLMFTNAGMNQFKDVFLATGSRPYRRAADTQKCIRAGGKHNDLDDVGRDTYHHTFFEMLGNWSFGDYFKKEAIAWAWELLTDVWGIDSTRLHATYFEGDESEGLEPDTEARDLWLEILPQQRVHPGNKKDNFWEMGETGPCGPCSEIHIDLTPDKSGANLINADDARVIELWNLVFIQFNRGGDGVLKPLPAKHVDTGMGFERLCAVLNGRTSNYDTDVWSPIFNAIEKRTGTQLGCRPTDSSPANDRNTEENSVDMIEVSYRVVADHIRCLTFAMTDGALPSNEGRGYVLRRILRRGVRYGRQYLNMREPFLCDLVEPLIAHMAGAFPELRTAHGGKNAEHVAELLRDEEESFGRTLDRGIKLFDDAAQYAVTHHHGKIGGEDAFKLHDTYGFPIDLTELMAEERGLTINIGEYERLMEQARERARAGGEGASDESAELIQTAAARATQATDDSLKYGPELQNRSRITSLARQSDPGSTDPAVQGEPVAFTVAATCFYAEAGGQISDTGIAATETGEIEVTGVSVRSVTPQRGGEPFNVVVHHGKVVHGEVRSGTDCSLKVSPARLATMKNHTATHMLNWALREVLGDHIQQKGSLVDAEKTRFDFAHNKPLSDEEIARVEQLVNERIEADQSVNSKEVDQKTALEINTLRAVFGEKYPDRVRVMSIGADIDQMLADPKNPKWMKYPVEFCGGTHLSHTGEAERFALTTEEAVAKGIRRVVGITGVAARQSEATGAALLSQAHSLPTGPELADALAAFQVKVNEAEIPIRIRSILRQKIGELQKAAKKQQKEAASDAGEAVMSKVASLLGSAETIGGATVIVAEVPMAPVDTLRNAIDWIRNKTDSSAVLLAMASEGKVVLVAVV